MTFSEVDELNKSLASCYEKLNENEQQQTTLRRQYQEIYGESSHQPEHENVKNRQV